MKMRPYTLIFKLKICFLSIILFSCSELKLEDGINHKEISYEKGRLFLEVEDFENALNELLASEKDTTDTNLFLLIGKSYHGLKEYDKAIGYYDRYIIDRPYDFDVITLRSAAKLYNMDTTGSFEDGNLAKNAKFQTYFWALLILITSLLPSVFLRNQWKDEFDRKSVKKTYLLSIGWVFGLHYIYLNYFNRLFLHFTLFAILLFVSAFEIR